MESKEIPYVSMERAEIPYVSMESEEIPYLRMAVEITYVSMNSNKLCFEKFNTSAWRQNKACLRNSIRQHEHKIRHAKEIPYVSMDTK